MEKLKKFYEDVETNAALKETLVAANEEMKGKSEEEIQEKMISIAKEFGYELTKEDFVQAEGELGEQELENVAGGISAGCFLVDMGCSFCGEITSDQGCILIGFR